MRSESHKFQEQNLDRDIAPKSRVCGGMEALQLLVLLPKEYQRIRRRHLYSPTSRFPAIAPFGERALKIFSPVGEYSVKMISRVPCMNTLAGNTVFRRNPECPGMPAFGSRI